MCLDKPPIFLCQPSKYFTVQRSSNPRILLGNVHGQSILYVHKQRETKGEGREGAAKAAEGR
jgi:hypothetical protein